MLAVFLVNAVGAASICSGDSSNPACNPNSLEFHPDYEYVYYRSDNGTSSPDNENGNKTDDGEGYPFFGNVGLLLNTPDFDSYVDFIIEFNGTVGNQDGDIIHAKLSSPLANDTLKFTLELLALDRRGNVFRFVPANDTDLNPIRTTTAPATTTESSKNSTDNDVGMFCIKIP
ncbi:hypothetical protein AVEN_266327-1 [Araneus ventricosus]|uniref:Uncharacterized protein n=1 Tax=Araneus ventricosus TaxID=182803 RepID=A0A4Y2P2V6_ARAVE|nr:hypothetical protein AVEN_266327-1 [Araneus ventricosus]